MAALTPIMTVFLIVKTAVQTYLIQAKRTKMETALAMFATTMMTTTACWISSINVPTPL